MLISLVYIGIQWYTVRYYDQSDIYDVMNNGPMD